MSKTPGFEPKTPSFAETAEDGISLPEPSHFPAQVNQDKLAAVAALAAKDDGLLAYARKRKELSAALDSPKVLAALASYGPLTPEEKLFCLGWAEAAAQMMPLDQGIAAWLDAYTKDELAPGG